MDFDCTPISWLAFLLLTTLGGVCTQNYGDLRLLQGDIADPSFSAGRLEIYINSTWGSICADNFFLAEANVACRQLGFEEAISTETSFHTPYGRGKVGPIWLDEVGCNNESILHLLSCANIGIGQHNCDHYSDVAVECLDLPRLVNPQPMDVRLSGGEFQSAGRMEVYCGGQWGAVCNQLQFAKEEADAVCKQLGYTEAVDFSTQQNVAAESLQLPMWLGQLECLNDTDSIASCGMCGTMDYSANNSSAECSIVTISCAHTIPYGSLRLAQGSEATPNASEGRLEIFQYGVWGTICSSTYDLTTANISCKELGFLRTLGFQNSTDAGFGVGNGPVFLTGVQCTERDLKLNQCSTVTSEVCTHDHDVAVFCTNEVLNLLPNVTMVPPINNGPKISIPTLVGIMVGSLLGLILCCICCAVCVVHFYFVPYSTKKEKHALYFIEREASAEAETTLDQKLSELDSDPFQDGKSLTDGNIQRSRPKNRYVSLDTSRMSSSGAGSLVPQPAENSVPQPANYPESPTSLRRISVHSLHLQGSPLITHPPSPHHLSPAPSKGSTNSLLSHSTVPQPSFSSQAASVSQTNRSVIPTSIPIPPPLKHQLERNKAKEAGETQMEEMTVEFNDLGDAEEERSSDNTAAKVKQFRPEHFLKNSSFMSESDPTLTNWGRAQDLSKSTKIQPLSPSEHESTPSVLRDSPLTTTFHEAASDSTQPLPTTPSKGIMKSPSLNRHAKPQSLPHLELEDSGEMLAGNGVEAWTPMQPNDSPSETKQLNNHHVSFRLD